MSRPVPIVPEVLLLGTLPNPGDLERSIRLQLTPGSGPARRWRWPRRAHRGELVDSGARGGAATGLRPRHRRRPRRLGPVDGSVGGRAGAGADAAGEATGFRERRRIGVSELQRRTLHPAEPARPRRRGRPGGRAVRPAFHGRHDGSRRLGGGVWGVPTTSTYHGHGVHTLPAGRVVPGSASIVETAAVSNRFDCRVMGREFGRGPSSARKAHRAEVAAQDAPQR